MKYVYINLLLQAFHLVAGSYQQVTKGTEMRQRALDIFWTFFIENAVSKSRSH